MRPLDMFYLVLSSIGLVLYIGYKLFIKKRWKVALSKVIISRIQMISDQANLVGYRGKKSLKGNGYLLLTDKQLHFEQLWPVKAATVDLEDIREIKVIHRWDNKSIGKPLLLVNTQESTYAWHIERPYEWLKIIKSVHMKPAKNA